MIVCFLVTLCGITKAQDTEPKSCSRCLGVGDPRLCTGNNQDSKHAFQRFEVLPGIGWDNLQNEVRGQVVHYNHSQCLSTNDGKYLVPDQVFLTPIKESVVETVAEFIGTWHNASSTTANGINVNVGLPVKYGSISGSFSDEHFKMKRTQIQGQTEVIRLQMRHHRYKSHLQPDPPLHSTFKSRLLSIAAFIELDETQMARYESQLLVRDFGTHFLSSVTAGAGLVKTDFLNKNRVKTEFSDKTKMLSSAGFSFAGFGISTGVSHSNSQSDKELYEKCVSHSYITTHGGPILKASDKAINDWSKAADLELVPMDRSGNPLWFLVNKQALPELPAPLVHDVGKMVRDSIIEYYEKNRISGCTKLGSPNFSFAANFDDGSCRTVVTNTTFGGVYQKCRLRGRSRYRKKETKSPCDGMDQKNPKTRDYSCPLHYTDVELVTGRIVGVKEHDRVCESCGFLWLFECCTDIYNVETADATAHWCAGLDTVPKNSGYLFGGVFSSDLKNPLTGTEGCPPHFYPRKFLDFEICITEDFELGLGSSVPFAGFISCNIGNPLSTNGILSKKTGQQASAPQKDSLQSFMDDENHHPSSWPKHCPVGYSQHLLTIYDGCEVRYCLKSGALLGPDLPILKLPPFNEKPNLQRDSAIRVMFNPETEKWMKDKRDYGKHTGPPPPSWHDTMMAHSSNDDGNDDDEDDGDDEDILGLSSGAALAVGVVVTLVSGILVLVIYKMVQRRKRQTLTG